MSKSRNINTIILCGFMGCGKTSLSQKLEKNSVGWDFIDLDDHILEKYAKSKGYSKLGDYIRGEGEQCFRENETSEIEKLLERKTKQVISLGGGSLSDQNYERISQSGALLFWLNTNFSACWERIKGDKNRPFAQKSESEVFALYQSRVGNYSKSAIQMDTECQNSIESMEDLLEMLNKID